MEICLNSRKRKWERIILLLLLMSVGSMLMILSVFAYKSTSNHTSFSIAAVIWLLLLGASFCILTILHDIFLSREYKLSPQGIEIRYIKRIVVQYPWQSVSSIIACDMNHAAKDSSVFDYVLRIAIGDEKYGPNNNNGNKDFTLAGYERWRTHGYSIMHFKTVIILDYTPERRAQIEEQSGIKVQDNMSKKLASHMKAR